MPRKKRTRAAVDAGTYRPPQKMTFGQWLDIWKRDYLGDVKPRTKESYQCQLKNHIRPGLGAVKLDQLTPHMIQRFYNGLGGLSPKSVKNIHGVLHKALSQAAAIGYLSGNPSDACTLPRIERKELNPMDDDTAKRFIEAVRGHRYKSVSCSPCSPGRARGRYWASPGMLWTSRAGP